MGMHLRPKLGHEIWRLNSGLKTVKLLAEDTIAGLAFEFRDLYLNNSHGVLSSTRSP